MMNNNKPTPPALSFITLEGGEGAGKSSLIEKLENALVSWGYSVLTTREPGGTVLGEQTRHWLLTKNPEVKIDAKAELLLFLAARAQHIDEVINPAIHKGQIVICDRYNDSSVAYQGAGRGLGVHWVRSLCDLVCGQAIPDLTFYLDVDPLIGLERTRKLTKANATSGEVDRIESEKLEFHHKIKNAFTAILKAEPKRFYRLDANQSQQQVILGALKLLEEKFNK